jgi:hypothetical protein
MFEKPDARPIFLAISALCLLGAVVSAFFALASGIMFPQGQGSFLGVNIHVLYLFLFAGILWAMQHLRAMADREMKNAAPKKNAARKPKKRKR